jgi:hypothetical protein
MGSDLTIVLVAIVVVILACVGGVVYIVRDTRGAIQDMSELSKTPGSPGTFVSMALNAAKTLTSKGAPVQETHALKSSLPDATRFDGTLITR